MSAPTSQIISGNDGAVTFSANTNLVTFLKMWRLNIAFDMFTSAVFGLPAKIKAAGAYEWKGSAEGFIDQASALTISGASAAVATMPTTTNSYMGITGAITLRHANVTTDATFGGTVFISNIEYGVPAEGFQTLRFDFEGTGACTYVVGIT